MTIESESQLRALIPAPLDKIKLKILRGLERHSMHIIEVASLAVFSCNDALVLVRRGEMTVIDEHTLRIHDPAGHLRDGENVGGLVMVAGIQETLRVNGHATARDGEHVTVEVHEVFLQCPKAFVRSKLWAPETWTWKEESPPPDMSSFVEASPFAIVGTRGADDRGDVSPRGDPVGSFVRRLDDGTLLLPDRTGNHLVDTLRNVLHRPSLGAVFLLPGCADVLRVETRARITADKDLLAPSAVKGKAPKVGLVLDVLHAEVLRGVLAGFWDPSTLVDPKEFPTFGEMMLDQVNPGGKLVNKIGAKIFDLGSEIHKRRYLY